MDTKESQSPLPSDLAGWRRVVAEDRLASCRMEDVVAAVQGMGPDGEEKILQALMLRISNEIIRILRWRIGKNHANEGIDMIERAHGQLIEAVLRPDSADGKGLRVAFRRRIEFRAADAIQAELLNTYRYPYAEDVGVVPVTDQGPWLDIEQNAYVEKSAPAHRGSAQALGVPVVHEWRANGVEKGQIDRIRAWSQCQNGEGVDC